MQLEHTIKFDSIAAAEAVSEGAEYQKQWGTRAQVVELPPPRGSRDPLL